MKFEQLKSNPKYDLGLGKTPDKFTVANQIRFNIVDSQYPRPVVVFGPDRVSVDPSVEVDEAAMAVLNAIEGHIRRMIHIAEKNAAKEEREACAKIAESQIPKYERFEDQRAAGNTARNIAELIKARNPDEVL